MGSTHPPLESLLNLSQNCLEGFELSSLNRIANLRKEFREILGEWIELEIEARFARWALEHRHVGNSFPSPMALPSFVSPLLALPSPTHVSEHLFLANGDELPIEFSFTSMIEIGHNVQIELRLPLRHLPVSQDAAAALRSLEHFARCKALSIGGEQVDQPDLDKSDSPPSCSFLPFLQCEPAHELRNVSSRMTYVLAGTAHSAHYIVRYASAFVLSDNPAPAESTALPELSLDSRLGASRLTSEFAFAPRRSRSVLSRPSAFQPSSSQALLRRTAILLRN